MIVLKVLSRCSTDGIKVVNCFVATDGDFDFFIPTNAQVSSAEPDGDVAWTKCWHLLLLLLLRLHIQRARFWVELWVNAEPGTGEQENPNNLDRGAGKSK